jgi:uncharacterized LabA/DUF88 family protein
LADNLPVMHGANNFAFIDGANLHFTYENLGWKLDYQKLRNYLKKKLGVVVAYYFIGKLQEYEDIYTTLESYDYTIKLKDPSPYTTEEEFCPYCRRVIAPKMSKNKCDCDSFLTLQAMSDFDMYNKAVIITSDGDFDNLVKRLLQRDKLRMVFSPCKAGCSWLLRSAAKGRIAFIDEYRNELEKI